jgi:eukaryotic-like serine/threonine-protein kinase
MTTPTVIADRYRLLRPLAEGGMGRVWLAHDQSLNREVAVKEVVPREGLTSADLQELRPRTIREARAAARLSHPNVVRVFDIVVTESTPWIVMEYLPSRSLAEIVSQDGPVGPQRAAQIGLAVVSALAAAHNAGVLHRDVKPGNVLIADDGRIVLTDFGLATIVGDPAVTRTGVILGSPSFMAPERVADTGAGPAADLWSLGTTLYYAVEGRSPYERATTLATLAALATEDPPPAPHAGPLRPVITGLLRRDPKARLDANAVRAMLSAIAAPAKPPKRAAPRQRGRASKPPVPASPVVAAPVSASPVSAPPVSASATSPVPASPGSASPTSPVPAASASPVPASPVVAAPVAAVRFPAGRVPAPARPTRAEPAVPATPHAAAAAAWARRHRGRALVGGVAAVVLLALVIVGLARLRLDTPSEPERAGDGAAIGAVAPATSAAPPPSRTPAPTPTPSPSPAPTRTTPADQPALPAGWHTYTDRTGFSVAVPTSWVVSREGTIVYFREPGGGGRVLGIDQTDHPKSNPVADWRGQEAYRVARGDFPGYKRVRLAAVDYFRKAADWEFTYTSGGTRLHVNNRGFVTSSTQAYGMWWSTPDSRWAQYLPDLLLIQGSFRPAR